MSDRKKVLKECLSNMGKECQAFVFKMFFFFKHDLNKYINCKIVLIELNMKIKNLNWAGDKQKFRNIYILMRFS